MGRRPAPTRFSDGFTLIELLVVVAIVGILAAVAVPNFSQFMANRQMRDQMSAFSRSFTLARNLAVNRTRAVTICPSDAPEAQPPVCGGNWVNGWVIFIDGGVRNTIDGNDTVLRVQPGWANGGQIIDNGAAAMTFNPDGRWIGLGRTITFQPQKTGLVAEQTLTINAIGRLR